MVPQLIQKIQDLQSGGISPLVIAIDGRSGTGKSTLSLQLARAVNGVVIEGDDFYSGGSYRVWSARSTKENADACIDWRRLRTEALEPLKAGVRAMWHAFDWDTMQGVVAGATVVNPANVIILEGVYSSRSELADLVDLAVLLDVPEDIRIARLKKREGESYRDPMQQLWDEAEQYYFSRVRTRESFDAVLT